MSTRPQRTRKPPVEIIKSLIKYKNSEQITENNEESSEEENSDQDENMEIVKKSIKPKTSKSTSSKPRAKKLQKKSVEDVEALENADMDIENSNSSDANENSLWDELSRPNIAVKSVVTGVINRMSDNDSKVVDQVKCDLVNLIFVACDSTHPPFTVDFIENNDCSKCVEKTFNYTTKVYLLIVI